MIITLRGDTITLSDRGSSSPAQSTERGADIGDATLNNITRDTERTLETVTSPGRVVCRSEEGEQVVPFAVATIVTSEQILSAVDESGDDEGEATGTERGNFEPVSGPEPRLPVIGTHQGIALDANIEKWAGTRRARYRGVLTRGTGKNWETWSVAPPETARATGATATDLLRPTRSTSSEAPSGYRESCEFYIDALGQ